MGEQRQKRSGGERREKSKVILNENGSHKVTLEYLVPNCWNCLLRIRRHAPDERGVSLGVGFELLKAS